MLQLGVLVGRFNVLKISGNIRAIFDKIHLHIRSSGF